MLRLPSPRPLARVLLLSLAIGWAGCQAPPATVAPAVGPGPGRDAFVVLSGGGTPTSNNYSQFVQARALTRFLLERYPPEAVWIFFGQGNREGTPPVLADVYRQTKHDGLLVDTWLPGTLPANRGATKETFLRALKDEILPRVRDGGTLYLLVGDHGELTGGKSSESAITMWGLKSDASRPTGWTTERNYALTVSELRRAILAGIGRGRVVFAMTQCHSGGFHGLGVPAAVMPPRAWFLTAPGWLAAAPERRPRAAGFTATDEASIAAGCVPAPDPESWLGYERFLPEQLIGRDLLSDASLQSSAAPSFAAAHDSAVLIDQTIDRPRSTAEHYLERWAELIETRLSRELLLTPQVRAAVEAYTSAVETGNASASDPAWRAAHTQFAERVRTMTQQNPAAERLLVAGRRTELEKPPRTRGRAARGDAAGPASISRAQSQAWRETLRPAWANAVAAGEIAKQPAAVGRFEERLLQLDTRGRPAGFLDDWTTRPLDELYWASTYAQPGSFDAATAAAVTRWAAERRVVILRWADASPDETVRAAAAKFGPEFRRARTPPVGPHDAGLPTNTAAARTLFYRRVLAAWAFLLATNHQPALAELGALQALERTALPPPNK